MMRVGIVVATHPEDNSVDLVMADDGSRLVGVQVLSTSASARSGTVDLPEVPAGGGDRWDVRRTNGQDQKALVAFAGGTPVVVGFLFPQINQMTLNDPKTRLFRHQLDVVSVIDGNGNIDLRHPSGFAVRIGETPDHLVPAGMNADGNLALDRNTGRQAYMRISTAGNTAVITVSPSGAVRIECQQTLDIDAQGAVTIKTPVSVTHDAPDTICTGNLVVSKSLTMGAGGGTATMNGSLSVVGGSVTHNGKNIGDTHTHGGVQPGGGSTAAPN